MVFMQKKVHAAPGSFGETIRELRELRGYTLEHLSRVTGIHASVLRAFEDERLEDLADPFYAERHLRTIVRALDGRESYVFEKYHALLTSRGYTKPTPALARKLVRKRDLFVTSHAVGFVGFLLFVCIIGGYVVWQATLIASKPPLAVSTPYDGEELDGPHVQIVGVTDPLALVDVNGEQAVVDSSGTFHAALDVPRGLTTLLIQARRRYGSATLIERHVNYNGVPTASTTTTTVDMGESVSVTGTSSTE
jgi:transcriptional regulator with XRE-family HTH domain